MANYEEQGRRRNPYRIAIVLAIVLFLVVAPEMQDDTSMGPTLKKGDAVCVVKKGYSEKRGEPDRGTVVVMEKAWSIDYADDNIIGRVVGLPGDTVSVKDGVLYIDGEKCILKGDSNPELKDMKPVKIKKNQVFLANDCLGQGVDSTSIGPVPMKEIKGYAAFKIWPLKHIGGID